MIFVGDIAIPYLNSIQLSNFPDYLKNKKWFGNLEGSIVMNFEVQKENATVFNGYHAILSLVNDFNFKGFSLANNHIFDVTTYEEIISFLHKNNISYCGIGKNIAEASKPLIFEENNQEVVILCFGWEVIQCKVASEKSIGVNPLTKEHVLKTFYNAKNSFPNAIIVPYMHWSYELEAEPQPRERELAKALIDLGAFGVIGSHPHRIGGFEIYKNKPILYSLGNWMFKQNYYHNGRISFPDFCNQELAFEWDFKTGEFCFHFFSYSRENSVLAYSHTEDSNSITMATKTPFNNYTKKEYEKWYKRNHFHKNKGLPIYYWGDSILKIKLKDNINKLRDWFLKAIISLKIFVFKLVK